MADTGSGLPDQWWQGVVSSYSQDQESSSRPPTTGSGDHRQNKYSAGGILPTVVSAHRQSEGGHRHGPQDFGLFYNAMRFGMEYQDPGADHYEQQYRDRVVKGLHRRAAEFGFTLQALEGVS